MQHNVINNIRLDVNKQMQRVSVSIRKDDTNTRRLDITLVDHGQVIDLTGVSIAILMAKKPDGYELYNDCVLVGNEIQYTITTQTINVVGEVECNVQITYKDGSMLTSPTFIMNVYDPVLRDTVIESMNEYNAIAQFVVQAEQAAESAAQSAQDSADSADDSADSAILSESWAVGGTGKRAGEDENNASYYSRIASGAANEAAGLRDEAAHYAETATSAAESASQDAETASEAAEICTDARQAVVPLAEQVSLDAAAASANAASALESKNMAQSYAVGTNGQARAGDQTDNSKYYKEQAEQALSGNVIAGFYIDSIGRLHCVKTMFNDATKNHFDFTIVEDKYLGVRVYE